MPLTVAASALFAAENLEEVANNTVADFHFQVVDGRDEIEGALADFQGIKMLKAAEVTAIDVLISDAAEVDNTAPTPDTFGDVVDFVKLNPSVFEQAPFSQIMLLPQRVTWF